MVQVAENWSRIHGRVEAWTAPLAPGEPGRLRLAVDRVDAVVSEDGSRHRNLLAHAAGRTVEVIVPASATAGIEPRAGATVAIDVRAGQSPERVFAHPGPITLAP